VTGPRVAIVGATGQVGSVMRALLAQRHPDWPTPRFFASPRSAGVCLEYGDDTVVVEDLSRSDLAGIDYALMSIGAEASLAYSSRIVAAGAVVIDNSSAFRMDESVPLVVSEVNGDLVDSHTTGIIANPNCTTMIAAPVLSVLDHSYGLTRVVAATYQAVSGAGSDGVSELAGQVAALGERAAELTFGSEALAQLKPRVFPGPIAYNVVPHAGKFVGDDDETTEEIKFVVESRKILCRDDLAVTVTCVRVPVFTGHSIVLNLEFEHDVDPREAIEVLSGSKGVTVTHVPMPGNTAGMDDVVVGRIRRDPSVAHGLSCFVAGDNLRKGAALNAIQILELATKAPGPC
jgi:aspartate-semialdehyde dehydrogenase